MSFQIVSANAAEEITETFETPTAALDRARALIASGRRIIRILTREGRPCSVEELKGLADFENEADDA